MTPEDEAFRAAASLAAWFGGVSVDVSGLARAVGERVGDNLALTPRRPGTTLSGLEPFSREFLAAHDFAVGAGAIFAEQSTETGGRALEWWSRNETGVVEKLLFDLTPGSDRYYDYEKLPFFSIAASTGHQTLWGPYVDYLGFEDYILTFTTPFSVHGRFAGVAGCDLRLRDVERIFIPILRRVPGNAALLNGSDRVILGNSGTYLTGERVKPGQGARIALDVPHLGLTLLHTP
ncbi:cache domain-containing protein [Specibacter cremeus]|uniref:cache domain-containing protein n=1 Tax=Specibacter cremeus TaxID=1629051 RepID=UPI000F79BB32|nr:cache domain-containing protein [Specibacter cremeus]